MDLFPWKKDQPPVSGEARPVAELIGGLGAAHGGGWGLGFRLAHGEARLTIHLTKGTDWVLISPEAGESTVPSADFRAFLKSRPDPGAGVRLTEVTGLSGDALLILRAILAFAWQKVWVPPAGMRCELSVNLLRGRGLGDKETITTAIVRALAALAERPFLGTEEARLVDKILSPDAESLRAGGLQRALLGCYAPPGQLLPILNRVDILHPAVALHPGWQLAVWPGEPMTEDAAGEAIRRGTGLRMAQRLVETALHRRWHYPTSLSPAEFWKLVPDILPETLPGARFEELVVAEPSLTPRPEPFHPYPVFALWHLAVEESNRAEQIRRILSGPADQQVSAQRDWLGVVGQHLDFIHSLQRRSGWGGEVVDARVDALREIGFERGLAGVALTGDPGSSNLVLLFHQEARVLIEERISRLTPSGQPTLPLWPMAARDFPAN